MPLIDPKTLEREYDPKVGNYGPPHLYINPEDVNLSGYTPIPVGSQGDPYKVEVIEPHGPELISTGRIWQGFSREENGKHFVVGFEHQGTTEELKALR